MDQNQINALIFAAVDEVNTLLPRANRLEKSLGTVISGDGSRLDSLGLVNLIFAVEQKLEQQHGLSVSLNNDGTLNRPQDPFRTLGTLAEHIHSLVRNQPHG